MTIPWFLYLWANVVNAFAVDVYDSTGYTTLEILAFKAYMLNDACKDDSTRPRTVFKQCHTSKH